MNEYLRPLRAVFNGTVVTVIDANGRSVPWTVIEELLNYSARPEARTQEALTLLREAHMFATAQAFVADDFDAHCDRLAKFLGYTVDTHGPIKEKE